jgi:transposase
MGMNTSMTRLYGRAPGGERAEDKVPSKNRDNISVIGALRLSGIVSTMRVAGSIDSLAFNAYIENALVPNLKPKDIVLMDNYKVHLSKKAEELIIAAKARIIFLPAYSPDLSPIEKLWSKVKEYLRAAKARTKRKLYNAFRKACETVSLKDIRGWFESCGYRPSPT